LQRSPRCEVPKLNRKPFCTNLASNWRTSQWSSESHVEKYPKLTSVTISSRKVGAMPRAGPLLYLEPTYLFIYTICLPFILNDFENLTNFIFSFNKYLSNVCPKSTFCFLGKHCLNIYLKKREENYLIRMVSHVCQKSTFVFHHIIFWDHIISCLKHIILLFKITTLFVFYWNYYFVSEDHPV
jgi:hypothetical protein